MSGYPEQVDKRVAEVLEALAAGRTRDDIALQYGLRNHASLDQYMRRHHFVFDPYLQTYKKTRTHPRYVESEELKLPYKVTQILMEFRSTTADPREVASRLGFQDHKAMAEYMREQGFEWNSQIHNYRVSDSNQSESYKVPVPTETIPPTTEGLPIDWGSYMSVLQMLVANRNKLVTLLDQTPPRSLSIPRYALKGGHAVKAVKLASGLDELIRDFSLEKKLSQREIVEVALIQFFYRYGFGKRVEELFIGD